jgi:virginiamycin B lyase
MPMLVATLTLLLSPSASYGVRISQHVIAKLSSQETLGPATAIAATAQGLVISGSRPGAYEPVVTTPSFSVGPGTAGLATQWFFPGPDGLTWFLGGETKKEGTQTVIVPTVSAITPGGPLVHFAYPSPRNEPLAAATGPDGAIWLVETAFGAIDHLTSAGVLTSVPLPIRAAGPVEIASGPGGALWVTNIETGAIAEITTAGEVTEHLVPGPSFGSFGSAEPYGITVGPDGALWFTAEHLGAIGRITASGEMQSFAIPAAPGTFQGGVGAPAPRNITVGPEGALWFTDPGTNSIGRVSGGQVTEYPIPGGEVGPTQIVSFGGELWFTEETAIALGSVNPTAPPMATPEPQRPSISSVQVASALSVNGGSAKIGSLLKSRAYITTIRMPAAGTATITWTTAKHQLIASGSQTLSTAGTAAVKVRLTSSGIKALRSAKSFAILAHGTVTLAGASPVSASRSLVLKR